VTDIFPGATVIPITQKSARTAPNPSLAFSVIHITAVNSTAVQQATYWKNNPQVQVGATFVTDQNGSIVQCLTDPARMTPWTNGVLNRPDVSNPRIAACVRDRVNPNTRSLITIENCGREPGTPITEAQEAACARLIAHYHAAAGVPITRQTVIGHYQLDSVNRPNCPSTNKALIDRIVELANGEDMAPGYKQAGPPIGTFTMPAGGHALISPTSLTFYPQPAGGTWGVLAALDLKDVAGNPIDINGNQPPVNNRDKVYLVDAPNFQNAAWALRSDGTFTPAAPQDCADELEEANETIAELSAAVATQTARALDAEETVADLKALEVAHAKATGVIT
jgi:hypothetical protein